MSKDNPTPAEMAASVGVDEAVMQEVDTAAQLDAAAEVYLTDDDRKIAASFGLTARQYLAMQNPAGSKP